MGIKEYANAMIEKVKSYKPKNILGGKNEAEEDLILGAEVVSGEKISEPTVDSVRKKRNDFFIELVLFFVLGILIGIAVKNAAVKRVTMGYDDYKMKIHASDFDINLLQKQVFQKIQDEQEKADAKNESGAEAPTESGMEEGMDN